MVSAALGLQPEVRVAEHLDSVAAWQVDFHTAEPVVVEAAVHDLTGTGRTTKGSNEVQGAAGWQASAQVH